METTPTTTLDPTDVSVDGPVDGDVRAGIVDELLAARHLEHTAQLQQVWMAVQWALAHPAEVDADGVVLDYAGWGEPGLLATDESRVLVPIAGPGAPLVHPLAPLELGAALDRSHDHARQLLGDALELVFRLPRLWALTQDGRVPVWLARQISRETHDLTFDAARHADRLITAVPDKVARVDAARLVHEARLTADPDRVVADEENAMSRRGVWLRRDRRAPGVVDVNMTLDADDADLLDATIARVAADLRDLGDTTSRDVRRATAVGILADPQHALDLMSGRTSDPTADPTPRTTGSGGDIDLVVHLTPDDLTGGHGAFVEETRGAVSAEQLAAWVRRRASRGGRVRIRRVLHGDGGWGSRDGCCATSSTTKTPGATSPTTRTTGATSSAIGTPGATSLAIGTPGATSLAIGTPGATSSAIGALDATAEVDAWLAQHGIDVPVTTLRPLRLTADDAVDTHDPPPLVHEQVVTRDAHCVFPGCRRDSRRCDLDHIEPYRPPDEGGPPGQTRASNLAPLCRRHHNAKTHHGWTYHRAPDGSCTWTSPTGHTYVVVPHTRAPLGR